MALAVLCIFLTTWILLFNFIACTQVSPDPDLDYVLDPDLDYVLHPDLDYLLDPDLDYVLDPNLDYVREPDVDYVLDPDLDYVLDPDLDDVLDPDHEQDLYLYLDLSFRYCIINYSYYCHLVFKNKKP